MRKVRIAELKANLREHLRSAYAPEALAIRKAKKRLRDLKLPAKPAKRTDSVAALVQDRGRR